MLVGCFRGSSKRHQDNQEAVQQWKEELMRPSRGEWVLGRVGGRAGFWCVSMIVHFVALAALHNLVLYALLSKGFRARACIASHYMTGVLPRGM
jgi:hypothetical protein